MLQPTDVAVSGSRFTATYRIDATTVQAGGIEGFAAWMAAEMTVEFPVELLPDDGIRRHIVGRVEDVAPAPGGGHLVRISVAEEVVSGSMTQLLSVVWGNVGLAPGVHLVAVEPPAAWPLPGPAEVRGIAAFRALADAPSRPLLMSALKPLGTGVEGLATMAVELAEGGLDVVKEDQSLADQPFAPFADRVGPIAEAVRAANDRAGTRAIYAPSLNGPVEALPSRAALARDVGAGAVMVQPGVSGFPAIAAAAIAGLPVIAHPGGLGGVGDRVAQPLLHGTLARLAGADCTIFLTPGGRFAVDPDVAVATVRACTEPLGDLPPILPAAGGGITVERVGELRGTYGDDICLLIGGDLHRDGVPRRRAAALREAVER